MIQVQGLQTSLLSLGTMTFGMQCDYQQSARIMDYAVDKGINFFDTAELYPSPVLERETMHRTEDFIGKWMLGNKVKRDKIVFVSKVMGPTDGMGKSGANPRPNPDPLSPKTIQTSIDGVLKRLHIDCLDIFLVHWPVRRTNFFGRLGYVHGAEDFDVEQQIFDIIKTMDGLIKDGKIRHYGVSNESAWGLMKYIQIADANTLARPVTIQNAYSLLNRSFEVGLAEIAIRENIGLMAYSVLGGGMLTGKHLNGYVKGSRYDLYLQYYGRYLKPQGQEAIKEYVALANKHGVNPAQMAIAFCNQRDFLLTTITGQNSCEQLDDYIESEKLELSPEMLEGIEKIHTKYTYPCP